MHFVSYFDWNRMDYADFRYYLVKSHRFDGKSELIDREALIDTRCASVWMAEE